MFFYDLMGVFYVKVGLAEEKIEGKMKEAEREGSRKPHIQMAVITQTSIFKGTLEEPWPLKILHKEDRSF